MKNIHEILKEADRTRVADMSDNDPRLQSMRRRAELLKTSRAPYQRPAALPTPTPAPTPEPTPAPAVEAAPTPTPEATPEPAKEEPAAASSDGADILAMIRARQGQ